MSKTIIIIVLNRFTIWEVFVMPVTMFSFMYTFFIIFASHKGRLVHGFLRICHIKLILFSVYKACRHPTTTWVVGFWFFSLQRKTVCVAYGTDL